MLLVKMNFLIRALGARNECLRSPLKDRDFIGKNLQAARHEKLSLSRLAYRGGETLVDHGFWSQHATTN